MKTELLIVTTTLLLGTASGGAVSEESAEAPKREYVSTADHTTLLHEPLFAVPGIEARVLRVDLPAGWVGERHLHPGDVFVYVLDGQFAVDVEGEGRKVFGTGEVYHEALNTVMQARNLSATATTRILLFQVGSEGEPFMVLVE